MKPLSFTQKLLHRPRQLWLRKAVFQIHLWAGLAAVLYLVTISLSGTVLVFKDELVRAQLPAGLHPYQADRTVAPEAVLRAFATAAPSATVRNLQFPSPVLPAYLLEGTDAHRAPARWLADPETGSIQPAPRTWVDWVHDLHYYLLLPSSWGMQANGLGAAALLLLAASGITLWWPGTRLWTRGLRVNLRAGWRRINYDLHSAIGFWTLAIVLWWAFSGLYFGWYRQLTAAIAIVSPIRGMAPPPLAQLAPQTTPAPTLVRVLAAAQAASPQGHLWSVSNPTLAAGNLYVLLDRGRPGNFAHRDIVCLGNDARVLSVWHYGERHTLGDWLLWSMHPFHFGTLWGLGFKVLWACFGLTLACLAITGTVIYANRYLRPRWPRARPAS